MFNLGRDQLLTKRQWGLSIFDLLTVFAFNFMIMLINVFNAVMNSVEYRAEWNHEDMFRIMK